jgi:molybdenum cofactor cytidylyltransferase
MTDRPAPTRRIAAVVAAAGRSTRMGAPKQLLPWQGATVVGTVVDNLHQAGAGPVVVVVGHEAEAVAAALAGKPVQIVPNPAYRTGEMLASHQAGLRYLLAAAPPEALPLGALLALGDQPHIPAGPIRSVVEQALATPQRIVIPSYNMRRGHPIYLPAALWGEALALGADETLRTLLNRHAGDIHYVDSQTPAVLRDIDTPDDYAALKPR